MQGLKAGCAVFVCAAGAHAATIYNFGAITANSVAGPGIGEAQLSVSVDSGGAGLVSFLFKNTGATGCFIGAANWDDAPTPLFNGISSVVNGAGVNMVADASPQNLPAGDPISYTSSYGIKKSGAAANGVNPGEQVEVLLTLAGGKTLADVIAALNTGGASGLRVGIHLQGLPNGASESFVSVPNTVVPLPGAAGLGFAGLTLLGAQRSRRACL